MAELIRGLDAGLIASNVERVRGELREAREAGDHDPAGVELLVAAKYVALEDLELLARAGITLLGENRAQDLEAKALAHPGRFTFDFIGHLQSRKVRQVLPHARLIHSVSSDSVLEQLGRHGSPQTRVLVEVNVAGDEAKSGIAPADLGAFIARCPVTVAGLMTMPPLAADPQASRPHFAALAKLAAEHGLSELSMGTSQDYLVAAQEGATIVRIGSVLLR